MIIDSQVYFLMFKLGRINRINTLLPAIILQAHDLKNEYCKAVLCSPVFFDPENGKLHG